MRIENGICRADGEGAKLLRVVGCREVGYPRLRVSFDNGEERETDISPLLGLPAFRPLADEAVFRAFAVEHGIVTWPGGDLDIAPEWLFDHGRPCPRSATEGLADRVAEPAPVYGGDP